MASCGSTQESAETDAWRSAQDRLPASRGACYPRGSRTPHEFLAKNINIRAVREAAAVAGGRGRAARRAAVRWSRRAEPVQAVRGARRGGAARAAVARSRRPTRVAFAHSLRSVHRGLRSWYRHQVHDGLRCLCDPSETAHYHLLCTFHSSYHKLIRDSLVNQLHPWWHVLLTKVHRFFKKSSKFLLF